MQVQGLPQCQVAAERLALPVGVAMWLTGDIDAQGSALRRTAEGDPRGLQVEHGEPMGSFSDEYSSQLRDT